MIYCFLTLMLVYSGGPAQCSAAVSELERTCSCRLCQTLFTYFDVKISQDPGFITHAWPFCKLPVIALGSRFIRLCKQGCLYSVSTATHNSAYSQAPGQFLSHQTYDANSIVNLRNTSVCDCETCNGTVHANYGHNFFLPFLSGLFSNIFATATSTRWGWENLITLHTNGCSSLFTT